MFCLRDGFADAHYASNWGCGVIGFVVTLWPHVSYCFHVLSSHFAKVVFVATIHGETMGGESLHAAALSGSCALCRAGLCALCLQGSRMRGGFIVVGGLGGRQGIFWASPQPLVGGFFVARPRVRDLYVARCALSDLIRHVTFLIFFIDPHALIPSLSFALQSVSQSVSQLTH